MARRLFHGPRARRLVVAALAAVGLAAGFALDHVELRGVMVEALTATAAPETGATPAAAPGMRPGTPRTSREASPSPGSGILVAPPPVAVARTGSAAADPGRAGPRAGPFADGLAALRRGDAHGAARAFEAAHRIAPHSPEILANLGFAYLALGRTDEAVAVFERAIAIAPMMAGPYYGVAQSAEARGDLETARGAMRTYLHLAPQDDGFRRKAMAALWEWTQPAGATADGPAPDLATTPPHAQQAADSAAADGPDSGTAPISMASHTGAHDGVPLDAPAAPALSHNPAGGILDAPLTTLDGAPTTLAPYADRLVVLNIWAAWCGPCRMELPSLDRLAATLDPARAAVVGVSIDRQPAFTREFLRQTGVGLPTLWDGDGALTRDLLDVRALPLTLVLAPGGAVLLRHEGALDWAATDVAAALAALAQPGGAQGTALARLTEAIR